MEAEQEASFCLLRMADTLRGLEPPNFGSAKDGSDTADTAEAANVEGGPMVAIGTAGVAVVLSTEVAFPATGG